MRTSFWGLQVGLKALTSQQKALDVTGHNIANANTQGYSRQRAILSPTTPYTMPGFHSPVSAGQMGTGVRVEEVMRIRDRFTDMQIRDELRSLGRWGQKAAYYQKIEVIFNEPSEAGLRSAFSRFYDSLQDLGNNPSDRTARSLVIQRGHAVTETFNTMTRQLRDTTVAVETTLQAKVDEINSYARQIRDINDQILKVEVTGNNANDLRDRRDLLVDQLSQLIAIDAREHNDGTLFISTGGRSLVQGVYHKQLELTRYDGTEPGRDGMKGLPKIVWADSKDELSLIKVNPATKGVTVGGVVTAGPFEFHGGKGAGVTGNNSPDLSNLDGKTLEISVNGITKQVTFDSSVSHVSDIEAAINAAFSGDGIEVTVVLDGDGYLTIQEDSIKNSATSLEIISGTAKEALFGTSITTLSGEDPNNILTMTVDGVTKTIDLTGDSSDKDDIANKIRDAFRDSNGDPLINVSWDATTNRFTFETVSTGALSAVTGFSGPVAKVLGLDQATIHFGEEPRVEVGGWGELSGLLEVRNQIIPNYVSELNKLMVYFADSFNHAHSQGYDLKKEPGGQFFQVSPAVDNDVIQARYLQVAITDPEKIAAAKRLDGVPGDGDNALDLAALRYKTVMGSANFDEYVRSMVGSLGIKSQEAIRMTENQNLLVMQMENQRQSLSGVSLDEEMTNLIRFQHAYGAAARLVTTVDQMLDVVVNRLGVVGR